MSLFKCQAHEIQRGVGTQSLFFLDKYSKLDKGSAVNVSPCPLIKCFWLFFLYCICMMLTWVTVPQDTPSYNIHCNNMLMHKMRQLHHQLQYLIGKTISSLHSMLITLQPNSNSPYTYATTSLHWAISNHFHSFVWHHISYLQIELIWLEFDIFIYVIWHTNFPVVSIYTNSLQMLYNLLSKKKVFIC